MWISCLEWSSILIDDANGLWLASETKHIVTELHDAWRDARLIALWETDVIDCLVVLTIALELATKDSIITAATTYEVIAAVVFVLYLYVTPISCSFRHDRFQMCEFLPMR